MQWLASEAWSTAAILSNPRKYHHILQGTLGFAIRGVNIPGFRDFLLRLNPSSPNASEDPFLIPFWEEVFQCSLDTQADDRKADGKPSCTGTEDLKNIQNTYTNVDQLRISYNVYKAVYAVAYALKAMRSCVKGEGPFPQMTCPDADNVQPWQVPCQDQIIKACLTTVC